MILHRRIHKLRIDQLSDGLALAVELNRLAVEKLGKTGMVYHPGMIGSPLSRRHVVIDTYHDSLAAMEQYYLDFAALPEVRALLPRWMEAEEESWSENYVIVVDSRTAGPSR
jgi:hypothetical protein